MHKFRVWWNSFKTVALLISFITNFILIIVLLVVLMQLFSIKNGILEPLIDGLHTNFVGMDEATIYRTIQVEDEIPVVFDLPLNQSTNVVLTQDVPIAASATFTLPGGGGVINGRVDIVLPRGLVLPVELNMIVPVNTTIPINLPVDVAIPLKETELHTPFQNLRGLLEPYVRLLDNLPGNWDEVPDYTIDALQGEGTNVFTPTEGSENPWPGPEAYHPEAPSAGTDGTTGPTTDGGTGTEPGPDSGTDTPGPEITPTPVQDIGIVTPPPQ
jgi:hypothetical protein